MRDHPDRLTLLAYLDGAMPIDRDAIGAHVSECSECRRTLHEMQQRVFVLADGDVFAFLADRDDTERAQLRAELLRVEERIAADDAYAEECFALLKERPLRSWDAAARTHAEFRTLALMRRVLREVEREMDRRPAYALDLVGFAARWVRGEEAASRITLGDVWKQRSNALRHLGRYPAALEAAEMAEVFYESVAGSEFDVGQARYTTAVVFIKMNRYEDALGALDRAEELLAPFGESVPLAKVEVLRAGVLFQQGDVVQAEARWRAVIPALTRLGDDTELARVRANLAECRRAAGAYDDALTDAKAAIAAYRKLGMDAERIRAEWTVANLRVASGDVVQGLQALHDSAVAFERLGMVADAGFVKLDIVEELLRQREWSAAAPIARAIVEVFTAAGVTAGSVEALSYLREAVEHQSATLPLVQYVREFVAADDPARMFQPPH